MLYKRKHLDIRATNHLLIYTVVTNNYSKQIGKEMVNAEKDFFTFTALFGDKI